MTERMTAQEYQLLINNKQNNKTVTLINEKPNDSKPAITNQNQTIINSILNSRVEYSVSDKHLSLVFYNARLMSVNQIFSNLQTKGKRYELFTYKKIWHQIIQQELVRIKNIESIKNKNFTLPFFESGVEITTFRQAKRLVDQDALITMFKFIIDALKRDEKNPLGVLAEDNPNIITNIKQYSLKGDYIVGIRLVQNNSKLKQYSVEELLKT